MMLRVVLLAAALLAACTALSVAPHPHTVKDDDADRYALPPGFLYGAGVSALQTEGAWNVDGKSESAVDRVILALADSYKENHLVAADSYHRFREDVLMASKLKFNLFKFSISWARLLPTADASAPNPLGVKYYNDLLNEVIAHNMTPVVTMNHFDHPQLLEENGLKGWHSRGMVAKYAEYARFVFDTFGDRVDLFITINEPNMYCAYFSMQLYYAGFRTLDEVPPYECMHNSVLGHKEAYRIFQEGKAQGKYKGKVGFSALLLTAKPATTSPEDVYAASMMNDLYAATTLHPVVYGDYPQNIKALLGDQLPKFTDEEKNELVDCADFLAINVYYGVTASYNRFKNSSATGAVRMMLGQVGDAIPFVDMEIVRPPGYSSEDEAAFATINPEVMKDALLWTWQTYKKPIIVAENGYADLHHLGLHDKRREAYHSAFLRELVTTAKDYDIEVLAYCAWSLLDSWEFSSGYQRPFGFVKVDYETGSLNRTLKDSKHFWWELASTGVVPYVENPDASPNSATSTTLAVFSLPLALLTALLMT